MRILNSSMNSASTSSSLRHSSICTHSFSSSANSNSLSFSTDSATRCKGLDLLVQAVHYVTGSMVGVPFIQRRVIRRRRRRTSLMFNEFIISEIFRKEEEEEEKEKKKKKDKEAKKSKAKRQRRLMALPLKYQGSVLHPWKRQRRRQRSIHIGDGSGL